jgi:hypothetical protein
VVFHHHAIPPYSRDSSLCDSSWAGGVSASLFAFGRRHPISQWNPARWDPTVFWTSRMERLRSRDTDSDTQTNSGIYIIQTELTAAANGRHHNARSFDNANLRLSSSNGARSVAPSSKMMTDGLARRRNVCSHCAPRRLTKDEAARCLP